MEKEVKSNLEEGFNKLFNTSINIKRQRKDKELRKKTLFISLIKQYEESISNSFKLFDGFGIDLKEYEDVYHQIIDKVILLSWGPDVYEVINYYLYDRFAMDGLPNCIIEEVEGVEQEIFISNPEELYNYLVNINPNFLK
jgi:hypothetical protein